MLTTRAAFRGTRFSSHVQKHMSDRTGYDPDARPDSSIIRSSSEANIEDMFWNVSVFRWGNMAETKRQQTLYDFPMSADDKATLQRRRRQGDGEAKEQETTQ